MIIIKFKFLIGASSLTTLLLVIQLVFWFIYPELHIHSALKSKQSFVEYPLNFKNFGRHQLLTKQNSFYLSTSTKPFVPKQLYRYNNDTF